MTKKNPGTAQPVLHKIKRAGKNPNPTSLYYYRTKAIISDSFPVLGSGKSHSRANPHLHTISTEALHLRLRFLLQQTFPAPAIDGDNSVPLPRPFSFPHPALFSFPAKKIFASTPYHLVHFPWARVTDGWASRVVIVRAFSTASANRKGI